MRIKYLFLLLIFRATITSFSQEVKMSFLKQEALADSIYFNHTVYSKKVTLEKSISLYTDLLERIKKENSEKYINIQAKKYAVKALLEVVAMRNDLAYSYLKKSLSLQQKVRKKDNYLKGHTHRQLYKYWEIKANQDSIIANTKIAEKAFRDTLGKHHKFISEAMYIRGSALGRKGLRREEIALCKKAIANNIAYQGEFNEDVAIQEHVLATVYGNLGYYRKELESYKKVIKRWEAIPEHKDMSYLNIAYNSIAICYFLYGDIKKAEQYILKSERLVKDRKNDVSIWFNETFKGRTKLGGWYYRGKLAAHKKDTVTALNHVNKILDFVNNFDKNKKENNPHKLSYFYEFVKNYQMAALRFKADLIRRKQPYESKKISDKILAVLGKKNIARFNLNDRLHIVDYYIKEDSLSKVNSLLDIYIKAGEEKNDDYSLINLYAKKGEIFFKQEDYKKMDTIYTSLFKRMQRDSSQLYLIEELNYDKINPYGSQDVLDILIKISANYKKYYKINNDEKNIKKAFSVIKLASDIFSKNFNHLVYNDLKHLTVTKINEQLLSITLLDNTVSKEGVLEIIENNGSKTIWNNFLNSQQRKYLNIPDSILQKENDLLAELYFYKKELYLNEESDHEKANLYKEHILSINNEIVEVEEWFQINYPKYFNQKIKPFKLQELKQHLVADQKVIKYIFTESNVFAFIITKNNTGLVKIGNKNSLIAETKILLELLKSPNKKGYKEKVQQLYKLFLPKDVITKKEDKELVFIQDDVLNYIPMEALIDEKGAFLIETYKVSYAPSLLLWNGQIKTKKSEKDKLGIYAPIYKKYQEENPKRNDSTALFGALKEATKIATIFSSESFIGNDANKGKFIKNASEYSMLHLAMHSSFNNIAPEFSSLNFSPEKKDHKLSISELYNLSLNADLAVLSACNTGSGELKKGEGLVNVSRAFTYAGVPSLVASLWAVPDVETSKIMISFYEELKKGKSKNEALQIAKLNYLKTTEYNALKHPYYWAGFVVSGDISPVKTSKNYWWFALGFASIIIVVFRKRLINFF
ncbi:CHAT domain-containing protein [Polaribacter sp. Asnod1-A03]|uniref:CHAT domain-containing protein n=1 Tax=Polaribacter sp. Asnod1-A03 TaxID=3160581 RepID=UPI0038632D2F